MTNKDNLENTKTDIASSENEDFSVSNIFEDFENDLDMEKDIDKKQNEIQKDSLYYLKLISSILKVLNIILFLAIIVIYFYIDIQKSNKSYELFNPICSIFLWDSVSYNDINTLSWTISWCPSIKLAENVYENSFNNKKETIYSHLLKVATDYYTMKDFINSKEVVFLLDKSQNKKNPLKLLEDFDRIKNNFLWNDRLKIQCNNVEVTNSKLTANCFAYSSLWDRTIPWFNWWKSVNDLRWWTSISIASSFLNFLEKQNEFSLIHKQKVFKIQSIAWEWSYSYKTPFSIELVKKELNLNNN